MKVEPRAALRGLGSLKPGECFIRMEDIEYEWMPLQMKTDRTSDSESVLVVFLDTGETDFIDPAARVLRVSAVVSTGV